jgi:hypothetical protein
MAGTIERKSESRIRVTDADGGHIESQTVEANLLFAIIEKLEEIRCCTIDVESACDSIRRQR